VSDSAGPAAVLHVFSVGVVWMSVHCAGMCGPLVGGLDVSGCATRGKSARAGGLSMLLYQGGRAFTLASLGAAVGLVGAGLGRAIEGGGVVVALALGAFFLFRALRGEREATLVTLGKPRGARALGPALLQALTAPLLRSTSSLRPLALGAVMGFLPCMIVVWALGLSASTASPLWGALTMLALVVVTTPVIVAIGVLPRLGQRLPLTLRRVLPRVLLGVSGLWMLLMGLAAAGVVGHVHVPVTLFGRGFQMMVW
jgi:sulfite exporter TauE/SafE